MALVVSSQSCLAHRENSFRTIPFRSLRKGSLQGDARAGSKLISFRSKVRVAAGPDEKEELLPWERNERLKALGDEKGDLPFGIYLLGAAIIAIAAVGSIFEIINKNPIFGVLPPSNPLWLPILGFFGVTGLPSAGFLFIKAINSANAESDRQNKADGY